MKLNLSEPAMKLTCVFGLFFALSGLVLPPVHAAETQMAAEKGPETKQVVKTRSRSAQDLNLGAVVVTPTRTERTVLEAPQSIDVITEEEIRHKRARNMGDILRDSAGISIEGGPRPNGESPNIRGLGGNRVQLRLDNARLNPPTVHGGSMIINIDEIKEISTLKGSSSALYGSDALGGVIAVTTKDGRDYLEEGETAGFDTSFTFSTVDREFRETQRVYGIINDYADIVASFTKWDTGDSLKMSDGNKLNYNKTNGYGVFTKVAFRPFDDTSVKFTYNRYDERSRVPLNATTAILTSTDTITNRDIIRDTFNLDFQHTPGEGLLADARATFYWHFNDLDNFRFLGTSTNQKDTREINTFGFDIKNTNFGSFDTGIENNHALTYGVEFWHEDLSGGSQTAAGNTSLGNFPNGTFFGLGVFIQDEITFWDERLTLIPGLRWDHYESDVDGQVGNREDYLSPKIAGVFKITDDISLFSSFGLGFRAPQLEELYTTGTHFAFNTFVPDTNLKPEKSNQFEVGLRGSYWRLEWETVYFLTHADDFITLDVNVVNVQPFGPFGPTLPGGTSTPINESEVRLWGFENTVNLDMGKGFSAFLQHTFIRGRNTETDKHLDTIAPPELYWGVEYRNGSFLAGIYNRYASDQQRTDDPDLVRSGIMVWNTAASYQLPDFENPWLVLFDEMRLSFGIENIFNHAYKENLSSAGAYAPARSYTGGLSKSFTF